MEHTPEKISKWQDNAAEVSSTLRSLGNERRLLILCQLGLHGELHVGGLLDKIELSQSALSQHLAKMRDEGIVATRRQGQSIWYRIADPRVERVMETLYQLYCSEAEAA